MQWSQVDRAPSHRILRQFSALCIAVFGAVAIWQGLQGSPSTAYWAALALTVGPAGLVWPRLVRPIFVGWMLLTFPIGWAVSRALLGVVFFGLITPMALVFKARGRDLLQLRRNRTRSSYWTPRLHAPDRGHYFRQF